MKKAEEQAPSKQRKPHSLKKSYRGAEEWRQRKQQALKPKQHWDEELKIWVKEVVHGIDA